MFPSSTTRRGRAARLAAAVVATAFLAAAQQPPQRLVERPIDFGTSQDDNLFSVLRSQDHIHELELGLAELDAGEHRAGVERLHHLLQIENGGVVPVAPGRFLGLRLALVVAMANMSPGARAAYEELVRREGGAVDGFEQLGPEQLLQLAERFPTAEVGRRARLRLGDLALTAGNGNEASGHFRLALDAAAIGSTDERRVVERLRAARALVDPTAARADRARASAAIAASPEDDVLAVLPAAADGAAWPALGGGGSGRTPMARIAGQPDTRWSDEVVAPGFGGRDIAALPMYAVGDLDGLFVHTGHEVVALDPLRREVAWISRSPMREFAQSAAYTRGAGTDGINQDMVLAAACDADTVVAALQVPEKSMNVEFQGNYRVMTKIPMRRLYAFSRQSGKVVWSHYDELDGPRTRRFRGHDACASPLIAGDTVYAPTHDRSGAIAFAVSAYELRTGQPKWRRLVCSSQQDVNMFGNARTEFAASPLCLHDGVLFGASNLGVAFAVEAVTGRMRWITSYDVVRMPLARMSHQQDRQVFFANNSPVVADGVLCTTPVDSQYVLGLDVENGRRLWRLPPEATAGGVEHRVFWLAGAFGDEFVLAGAGAVAVRARPRDEEPAVRQLVRPEALFDRHATGLPSRPAVTADGIWFARQDALLGFDRDGEQLPQSPLRLPRLLPGNLLLVGGIAVSVRNRQLEIAYDAAALRQHVEDLAAERPGDPALLLRLASLRAALLPENPTPDAVAAVQRTYQQGLDAALARGLPSSHPVRQALQRELYAHARKIADVAVARGADDALPKLAAARDLAPDVETWIEVQAAVLERAAGDTARFRDELDRLERRAPDATFPAGDGVPVATWVAWQRARVAPDAAAAVHAWQELLERHGDRSIGQDTAAATARREIDALVKAHGAAVYAPVDARAQQALARAGDDRDALAAVARTFPNSGAAASARARLLDAAVRAGDLAVVCRVFAQALVAGPVPPGVARRVLAAAARRGNAALAAAMADLLRPHAGVASDWPDDAGRTYGDVVAGLQSAAAAALAPLEVPEVVVAEIKPRSSSESPQLLPVLTADGFPPPADAPLYVRAGRELLAIDVRAPGNDKPVLFAIAIDFLEHVVLCGTTLVVPDMERVFAIDYRSGATIWELPNERRRILESLGVQHGVLHVSALPNTADGSAEFLGVEPLTGSVLFTQSHSGASLKPKSVDGALLRLTIERDGGLVAQRLDPVGGAVQQTITVAAATLRPHLQLEPDSLSARLYPLAVCSDGRRLFLPADSVAQNDAPRLLAIGADGELAWRWQGTAGCQLTMAALRGDRLVVLEGSDRRAGRLVVLQAADGAVVREIDVGHGALVLNWDRSWLPNPAPPRVAIESFADADRTQRQFVHVGVDDGVPTFVVTLGKDDGEIVPSPQFGADFVTFATRAPRTGGAVRLWALTLADRSGALPEGRKYLVLPLTGTSEGMGRVGAHAVVSGVQKMLLLGSRGPR